jgi:obg-like ATPase 1
MALLLSRLLLLLQARVNVPDDRFNWLVNTYKPKSAVSAYLDICDIAGLVK